MVTSAMTLGFWPVGRVLTWGRRVTRARLRSVYGEEDYTGSMTLRFLLVERGLTWGRRVTRARLRWVYGEEGYTGDMTLGFSLVGRVLIRGRRVTRARLRWIYGEDGIKRKGIIHGSKGPSMNHCASYKGEMCRAVLFANFSCICFRIVDIV